MGIKGSKIFIISLISSLFIVIFYFMFLFDRGGKAVVIASIADVRETRDKMNASAYLKQDKSEITQVLFGEKLEIIGSEIDGFIKVKVLDQYFFERDNNNCAVMVGWIEKDKILKVKEFSSYNLIVNALKAGNFYMGTKLEGLKKNGKFWDIRLPDGRVDKISEDYVFEINKVRLKSKDELRQTIINSAKSFLGAPYLWGGRSILGPDCSGLANICFSLCGIDIPRNARTQYQSSKKIKYDIKPADLVFISDTESPDGISHVMIYIGGDKFIEARGRDVRKVVSSYSIVRLGKKILSLKSGDKTPGNEFIFFGTYL